MKRGDYRTIAIAIKRARNRFTKDSSLSMEAIKGGKTLYGIMIEELKENIKMENSAFDAEKFDKSITE